MKAQDLIYQLEEGKGASYLKRIAIVVGVLALGLVYHFRGYQNFSDPKSMEFAQLARNISEGKGYTTQYIHPVAIPWVESRESERGASLRENRFPDVSSPPVYPTLLAGLMTIAPFQYEIQETQELVEQGYKHVPEVWISWFNQGLLLILVLLTRDLARRLFDDQVALLSVILILGSELFWRFSVSGGSTILLMTFVAAIARFFLDTIEESEEETPSSGRLTRLAVFLGIYIGLATLTRYAFLALLIPVLALGLAYWGGRRWQMTGILVGVVALIVSPWIVRNVQVCGAPFGVPGIAIVEGLPGMTQDFASRDLEFDISEVALESIVRKAVENTRPIVSETLPNMGGSWIGAFFLAGLLFPFSGKGPNRLRIFAVVSVVVFVPIQALGLTFLSDINPTFNGQNQLAIFAPLVIVFGVAFLLSLLDQFDIPTPRAQNALTAVVAMALCAPFVLRLIPPKPFVMPEPPFYPYNPPKIQSIAGGVAPDDLIMTDFPWAMAWYGDRQSISLTLDPGQAFDSVNLDRKGVAALYLTEFTLDKPMMSKLLYQDRDVAWGQFVMSTFLGSPPRDFPLRIDVPGYLPADNSGTQVLLYARKRWED